MPKSNCNHWLSTLLAHQDWPVGVFKRLHSTLQSSCVLEAETAEFGTTASSSVVPIKE